MITVTFSGTPAELVELFQSNGFLDVIRAQVASAPEINQSVYPSEDMPANNFVDSSEQKKPSQPPKKEEPKAQSPSVNRGSMVRATQEYASRMHNRYNGKDNQEGVDVCMMCAALIAEVTDGKATKTSAVPDEYVDKVFNAVKSDTIPAKFEYLLNKKES